MSKSQKERSAGRANEAGEQKPLIPPKYQHAVAIALLFLSIIVFFNQIIFGGKTFVDTDIIASHSFDTFLADAKKQGIFPLWDPYTFCGMPAYASLTVSGERVFDLTGEILSKASQLFSYIILNPPSGWVYFFYFLFACGMYLFTYSKLKNKFAAFLAAFAATFSTFIIIWAMVGHNTKIAVIAFLPYLLFAVEKLRERFSLPLAFLLVLLIHFSFLPSHVQMIFYVYLTLGLYLLFYLIKSFLKKKEAVEGAAPPAGWKPIVRTGVVLALAGALAFAMDADKYLSVWEYGPYSIRGSNPIVETGQQAETKTVAGGLDYDYATSWSLAPGEMMTWLVPSWYGFGLHEYSGPLSNNRPTMLNSYWGPQPFTHAPQYMGLIVLLLAIFGFVKNRKDPFVQFLGLTILLSVLISFGKEFPIVYDLMYRYFPLFNKFRIPSMILVLVQIFVPILAGYGVVSFMKEREQLRGAALQRWKRRILLGLGGSIVVCLGLSALYESSLSHQAIQNMFSSVFPEYALPRDRVVDYVYRQLPTQITGELVALVSKMVSTDLFMAMGLLVVALGSLYYFIQGKMRFTMFSILLFFTVSVDLWRVDLKPMDPQDRRSWQQVFQKPDYISFLQRDSTLFRVLQLRGGQPFYDNSLAYWRIQNAYGYQGAKMRAFQDVLDVVGLSDPLIRDLMNIKYIIPDKPDSSADLGLVYNGAQRKVYANLSVLPRAFFVNRYEVSDGLGILSKIRDRAFDPRDVVFFEQDPKIQVEPPHPAARAEFLSYDIQDMKLKTTTSGNNLLFLSETYYPEGWKASVDGKETPIYRADYLFRAVVVPAGIHTLELKFEPTGFYVGKNLSLFANLLVIGVLAFFGVDWWMKRKREKGKT